MQIEVYSRDEVGEILTSPERCADVAFVRGIGSEFVVDLFGAIARFTRLALADDDADLLQFVSWNSEQSSRPDKIDPAVALLRTGVELISRLDDRRQPREEHFEGLIVLARLRGADFRGNRRDDSSQKRPWDE